MVSKVELRLSKVDDSELMLNEADDSALMLNKPMIKLVLNEDNGEMNNIMMSSLTECGISC